MERDSRILRVIIRGRVQGVGFRAFTQAEATARGVAGWVRNRRSGEVEAVFAGPPEAVDAMCELCRQGPPRAMVEAVDIAPADLSDIVESIDESFRQLSTL